jgi:single-strand DNA-binding protein
MLPTLQVTALIQSKDTKFTQANKQVTSLRLSVGEKDKDGNYANFYFNATFWENGAKFVDQYFNEGDLIEVKGDLITTNYTKQDGSKVYQTELRFPKASFPAKPKNAQQATKPQPKQTVSEPMPEIDIASDTIPF